ncbi:MAG: hypothetical protein MUF64_00265 [Polyangiaceae bacterium]|jgi:hypothetical protein|nr:hypothetical protein [Polyangiaceae bacterium]
MSLVALGEQFYVLDQVNNRVTRWGKDGKAQEVFRMDGLEAADLAVGADGSVAVLDRLVHKEVAVFKDGKRLASFPLDEERFPEPGAVTGVFVDGDDVLVEKEHGALFRVGTIRGEPLSSPEELPGRPSRDGKLYLSAGIVDRDQGRVFVAAVDRVQMEARFTRQLSFPGMLLSIAALDSDKKGIIYLGVTLDQGSATPTVVTCLEPTRGEPLGSVLIPTNESPEESLKEITLTDDGTIVFAHRTEAGMSFESYRCP